MTAQKNTDSTYGAAVGSNILGKLNLPGLNKAGGPGAIGGGFQPKYGVGGVKP